MHEALPATWRGIEDGSVVNSRQNLMELGSEALATLRNSLMRNLWLCPLTNMLPVDPVRAEDGNVYERRAIHGWIYEAQFLAPPAPACAPPCDWQADGEQADLVLRGARRPIIQHVALLLSTNRPSAHRCAIPSTSSCVADEA